MKQDFENERVGNEQVIEEPNYDYLIMTPKNKVEKWAKLVKDKIKEGEQIAVFFDTETTGGVSGAIVNVIEQHGKDEGKLHRIIELGAIVTIESNITGLYEELKDDEGEIVRFHEYINPWAETEEELRKTNTINEVPFGAYRVHGIDKGFLFGKNKLNIEAHKQEEFGIPNLEANNKAITLKKPAPIFKDALQAFLKITGLDHDIKDNGIEKIVKVIAHNTDFDNKFMNSEFRMSGLSDFEAYTAPLCSLKLFRTIIPKSEVMGKYSLDSMYSYTKGLKGSKVEDIPRDIHGAYVDSRMLLQVVNEVLSTDFAIMSPNNPRSPVGIVDFISKKIQEKRNIKRPLTLLKFK